MAGRKKNDERRKARKWQPNTANRKPVCCGRAMALQEWGSLGDVYVCRKCHRKTEVSNASG